ncbi:MAG TPA: VWA domain-containing protein [Gemmatimonadaceae bacterium]|nr:VWA domain-containing protein [Gemmatimonadaceae bacterium]
MEGAASMMDVIDIRYVSWPWALALVFVLPAVTVWMVRKARRVREGRLSRLGTPVMIARLAPASIGSSRGQLVRLGLATVLLGIAFAGPRWGVERTIVKQPGIDIVLALDASSSMLARDEAPDRLTKMKQVVERLRELSRNDRFALIAFAGRSYVLSPVTVDDGALNLFIDNLDPTVVGQSGSSIASAIAQANNLLAVSESEAERAIVVMSDGEGFEDAADVAAEAQRATKMGATVITVGFGTPAGATIPVVERGVVTQKRDQSGAIVISRYSPDLLRTAAEAGRGIFVAPTDPDRAAAVREILARLRTEQRSLSRGSNLANRFQLFLVPALAMLLLDTFLSTRRRRDRRGGAVSTTASAAAAMLMLMIACTRGPALDRTAARIYNRGTAMLARPDSMRAALPLFDSAGRSSDLEVRYRAGFNGGYVHLHQGLEAKGDSAEAPLDSALAVYRRVLSGRPDDIDAKWNYELALRRQKTGGGGGGGGGGQPQPQPTPSSSDNETPQPRAIPGMTEQRAEQLLNAMEQEEQDVQGRKQRRSVPQPPPTGRDW